MLGGSDNMELDNENPLSKKKSEQVLESQATIDHIASTGIDTAENPILGTRMENVEEASPVLPAPSDLPCDSSSLLFTRIATAFTMPPQAKSKIKLSDYLDILLYTRLENYLTSRKSEEQSDSEEPSYGIFHRPLRRQRAEIWDDPSKRLPYYAIQLDQWESLKHKGILRPHPCISTEDLTQILHPLITDDTVRADHSKTQWEIISEELLINKFISGLIDMIKDYYGISKYTFKNSFDKTGKIDLPIIPRWVFDADTALVQAVAHDNLVDYYKNIEEKIMQIEILLLPRKRKNVLLQEIKQSAIEPLPIVRWARPPANHYSAFAVIRSNLVATATTGSKSINIWNISDGKCINTCIFDHDISSIISLNNDTMICSDINQTKYIINIDDCSRQEIKETEGTTIKYVDEGHILSYTKGTNDIQIINISNGEIEYRTTIDQNIQDIIYFNNYQIIYITLGQLCILNLRDNTKTLLANTRDSCLYFHSIAKLTDDIIICGGSDGLIYFWDIKTRTCVSVIKWHNYEITNIKVINQETVLFYSKNRISIWCNNPSFILKAQAKIRARAEVQAEYRARADDIADAKAQAMGLPLFFNISESSVEARNEALARSRAREQEIDEAKEEAWGDALVKVRASVESEAEEDKASSRVVAGIVKSFEYELERKYNSFITKPTNEQKKEIKFNKFELMQEMQIPFTGHNLDSIICDVGVFGKDSLIFCSQHISFTILEQIRKT